MFVPYVGKASIRFVKALSRLYLKQFDVRLIPLNCTSKVGEYFQVKSATSLALYSNVVYKLTCLCDTNLTYIGMSSRNLITRVREHLNLADLRKSAIRNHILHASSALIYNTGIILILLPC